MTAEQLVWLIPVPPLASFFIILLFTRKSKVVSDLVAVVAILLTWAISIMVLVQALQIGGEHLGEDPITASIVWLPLGAASDGANFVMGAMIDPLSAVLLFFVPLTATMIFIYSTGYMASGHYWTQVLGKADDHGHDDHAHGDDHDHHEVVTDTAGRELTHFDATKWKARFMAFISLFAGAMLLLTVADNLLLLFIGWEIMGMCSYLLIGFWHNRVYPNQPDRTTPVKAGIKAFMTTRVADMFFFIGIAWLYSFTGTLSYREIMFNEETLHALEVAAFPNIPAVAGLTVASVIAILIAIGTVGKSAQFPLHTWLPDAMEGPTPVSAMIHAATMVSAGIYLLLRFFPLITLGSHGHGFTPAMSFVSFIGAFTALFAATIAVAQPDVKKVLAYSTISQLGFMVAAIGIGGYVAAAFHLLTHAVFKALLFMGSGSVIHAVEHGEEHAHHHGHEFPIDFDAQDMFNMGGLAKRIPVTFWTFLIGGFALSGFPFITAGFWSKDEILLDSFRHAPVVFVVLCIAAFLTAFYTMRQISLTFLGAPRTAAAEEAIQDDWRMNLPLIVLAIPAILLGFIGVHEEFPGLGAMFGSNPFEHFVVGALLEHPEVPEFSWAVVGASVFVGVGGLLVGWLVYGRKPLEAGQTDPLKKFLGPIYTLLENKYYMDELYELVFVIPSQWVAWQVYTIIDRGIIDGVIHFVARAFEWFGFRNKDFDTYIINQAGNRMAKGVGELGDSFKYVQSGRVQQYMIVVAAGVLLLAGVFVLAILT